MVAYIFKKRRRICSIDNATPEEWDQAIDMLAINNQVGGNHYKGNGIQPIEYIYANGLSWSMGNVLNLLPETRLIRLKTYLKPSITLTLNYSLYMV